MFKFSSGSALMRLFALLAFALSFSGLAHAQTLPPQSISISAQPAQVEGVDATFLVTLARPATQPLTFTFFTSDGTAVGVPRDGFDADYQTTDFRGLDFTIGVGENQIIIPVRTLQDNSYEFDETFFGQIFNFRYNGSFANINQGQTTASATILNDDGPPVIVLNTPAPILESDSVQDPNNPAAQVPIRQNYNFTVTIGNTQNGPNEEVLGRPIELTFTTTDGTAVSGGVNPGLKDFVPSSSVDNPNPNPVQVPAGIREFQYTVVVLGDNVYEGDENFQLSVNYTSPVVGNSPSTATGIIRDNDLPTYRIAPPGSISQTTVEEGNELSFVVTLRNGNELDGPSITALQDITFNYRVQSESAVLGTDFTDPNNGTFTIPRGSDNFVLRFPTIDDTIIESAETFRFVVTDAVGTITPQGSGGNVGTGTILDTSDNSSGNVLTIQNVSVIEGTGGANSIQFQVNLAKATGQTVAVSYETTGLDVNDPSPAATPNTPATPTSPAPANPDYAISAGRLVFPPTITTATFSVPITTDSINEFDESFRIRLFNPANANFANNVEAIFATGTIIDDDAAGVISMVNATVDVAENVQGGKANILVNFAPTNGVTQVRSATVDFTTIPDTAVETGARDYFAKSGTLTFRPNTNGAPTRVPIPIEIINDNIREGNESFTVRLSNPDGATLSNPTETRVTIVDDEAVPVVSVNPANTAVIEGEGVKNFLVILQGKSQTPITIGYNIKDGTAIKGTDYQGVDGSFVFQPNGPSSFTIPVTILEDEIAEGNENFTITLTKDPADNSVVLSPTSVPSVVTIVDNDRRPDLKIGDARVDEGNTGTLDTGNELVFPVTLSRASSTPVTFTYALLNVPRAGCVPANGCDVATNADYQVAVNVPVSIAPGTTATEIRVRVTPDTLNEFNEQIMLIARAVTNAAPAVYADPADGSQRFGTVAFGTIVNDDAGGNITLSDPTGGNRTVITTIAEGYNRGVANRVGEAAFYTITLPAPAGRLVTVNYLFSGAADKDDVQDLTTGPGRGSVTFFPGDTTRDIVLRAIADDRAEGSERLNLRLSINDNNGPNSYTVNGANKDITILDRTPFVNTVAPNIGNPAYGTVPATRVTFNGGQLRSDNNPRVEAVLFGTAEVTGGDIQYLSDNAIAVNLPNEAKSGALRLRLVGGRILNTLGLTPAPGAPAALPLPDFIVQPVITSFTPTAGVATSSVIAITGRNFKDPANAVTGVVFANGTQVLVPDSTVINDPDLTVINDNRIDVRLPAGAVSGPLRIVSANGGVGPASQANLSIVAATAGNIVLGGNPDRNAIVEGSVGRFNEPVRNVNGGFHAPYQFFINPARQSGGANNGAPVAFTPVTVRFQVVASTGGGNVPRIQLRFDPANAGRPTAFSGISGANGIIDVELEAGFNPASPLEIAIVDAGTDNLPPIVGGAPANVTVTARIISSTNPGFLPITPDNQVPTIQVDRVEAVNPANQTGIAYGPSSQNNISIPFATGTSNSVAIADVFDTPPVVNGVRRYTIYRLDAANQMNNLILGGALVPVEDNGRLQRGVGYRLVVANNATVQLNTKQDVRGNALVVPVGNTFALNLTRNVAFAASTNSQGNSTNGYNLIGFPFDPTRVQNVDFNQATVTIDGVPRSVPEAAAAGLINPQLFVLDASGALVAAGSTTIQPFQSYVVQIFRNNATLTLRTTG